MAPHRLAAADHGRRGAGVRTLCEAVGDLKQPAFGFRSRLFRDVRG
jgi:hypothetical protein